MENFLRDLVAFQSVSGATQPSHELVEYVVDLVRRRGLHIERFISNGYESMVATVQPGDKSPTVMLAAHGDVVDAPEEEFELRRDGDRYYGRGAKDMKFALAVFLQVIDDLYTSGTLAQHSLGLMLTMDEEAGGQNGVELLMREGYRPKVCILPDGGENWQIQTDCKGFMIVKLTAHGVAVHSSRHWQGDNAITKLLPVIPELYALFPDDQGWDTNTVSVNVLEAGHSLSRVPENASLIADMRTVNQQEFERIRLAVEQLAQDFSLQLEVIAEGLPTHFDLADPMIAPFATLIEEVTGVQVAGSKPLASNDTRFMAPYGIPCISFYIPGEGHHSSHEWVSASAMQKMRQITRRYLDITAQNV